MNTVYIIILVIFTLSLFQGCATLDKTAKKKKEVETAVVDKELKKDVQALKAMLGYEPIDKDTADKEELKKPAVDFGMSVKQVQDMFPAPDKFEYDPMVNRKVTMLIRDTRGERFNFFFYEDKLYKIISMKRWSAFKLKFAENEINKLTDVLLEGLGEPDAKEADEAHKKMTWLKEDLKITLEEFNLMSHKGLNRILSFEYADRDIIPLARKDETFELYKTN